MALARATLSGIVLGDPEKRFTQNNIAVTNFSIQVTPSGGRDVPFTVRVICWRNLADQVASAIHKGDEVVVEGRLQVNQYEGAGGIVKRLYEVDASNIYLGRLESIVPSQGEGAGRPAQQAGGFNQAPTDVFNQQPVQQAPVGVAAQAPQTWHGETAAPDPLLTEDDIPF